MTIQELAQYIKLNVDLGRLARLIAALGPQLNDAQLRFVKALVFEQALEEYSNGKLKYVGLKGCDTIITDVTLNNGLEVRIEVKFSDLALYSTTKLELKETTGGIRLLNSLGTNTHKELPDDYADYLLVIGSRGMELFDKKTVSAYINPNGDGITATIPTNKGVIIADPSIMNPGTQQEVDFIKTFMAFLKTYINNVK
jgi:hypothetical protein